MHIYNKIFIFYFIILFLQACLPRGTDESSRYELKELSLQNNLVNFQFLKTSVLEPHCIRCHQLFSNESEVLRFVVPGKPEDSILFSEIESGRMPKEESKLSSIQVEIVRAYINGLSKSPTTQPTQPPVLASNYNSLKFHLFDSKCTKCHFTGNPKPEKIPPLDTYDSTKEKYEDILSALEMFDMPPKDSGIEFPTPEVINTLKQWKEAGFPEKE